MNSYYDDNLEDYETDKLIETLFHLGNIEHMQLSYELDEFYKAVQDVEQELLKRLMAIKLR